MKAEPPELRVTSEDGIDEIGIYRGDPADEALRLLLYDSQGPGEIEVPGELIGPLAQALTRFAGTPELNVFEVREAISAARDLVDRVDAIVEAADDAGGCVDLSAGEVDELRSRLSTWREASEETIAKLVEREPGAM